jgi:hypothetical protein
MTRSKDPFSDIKLSQEVGLDQRLFQQGDDGTTKHRTNATTEQRDNQQARTQDNELRRRRSNAAANRHAREQTRRPAPTVGIVSASERIDERHSHDIFRDQVRWMNRTKLDMEETYGKRITSNAIVKLALDLLIDDFERHGESSNLIRSLIRGERTPARTWDGPPKTESEGRDG